VLNGGGQVYAKDFICTNLQHAYNICSEITAIKKEINWIKEHMDDE